MASSIYLHSQGTFLIPLGFLSFANALHLKFYPLNLFTPKPTSSFLEPSSPTDQTASSSENTCLTKQPRALKNPGISHSYTNGYSEFSECHRNLALLNC